jgi:hypothetical protein|tara:strand:- start:3308 stop:3571 length:264 start_codon:yes stop_codon:yes gene_type:complete
MMRININNFHNRRQSYCPPHYTTTMMKPKSEAQVEQINAWIYENCHGKYCIIDDVSLEGDNPASRLKVGFENPGDLTLLALSGLIGD